MLNAIPDRFTVNSHLKRVTPVPMAGLVKIEIALENICQITKLMKKRRFCIIFMKNKTDIINCKVNC